MSYILSVNFSPHSSVKITWFDLFICTDRTMFPNRFSSKLPRSTSFCDFFRKTEDHKWRYKHKFQPETSISRPPTSCFRRSLIILHSESRPAKRYYIRFVRILGYRSFAYLRSHGVQGRRLIRTGLSSASRLFICQRGYSSPLI